MKDCFDCRYCYKCSVRFKQANHNDCYFYDDCDDELCISIFDKLLAISAVIVIMWALIHSCVNI